MIDFINSDEKCFAISCGTLEEEGVAIQFSDELLVNGEIDPDRVAILKPDAFYNTADFARPPKSVDGLVVVDCGEGVYFYVAELKSSRSRNISKVDVQQKFDTVFEQFFKDHFSHVFERQDYNLKDIRLWLVCDPFQIRNKCQTDEEYVQRVKAVADRQRGMLAEMGAGYRPYRFRGFMAAIKPILSPPVILSNGFIDLLA